MMKFLKAKYVKEGPGWRGELGECWKLSFAAIYAALPDLADRIVLIRSRVRELKYNFADDALHAHRSFVKVTAGTIAVGVLVLAAGVILTYYSADRSPAFVAAVAVLVGGLAALTATGAGAFGLHKRYSAMFASQWAMKALETNIDVVVYDIVLGVGERDRLEPHEIERLQRYLDTWLAIYTNTLTSFGEKYGSALAPVSSADVTPPAK